MACVELSRQSYVFLRLLSRERMVSWFHFFFLGLLPIWSHLPLVSSFSYHHPSCLTIPLISARTDHSNVHAAENRYLNKNPFSATAPTSCNSRVSLPILYIPSTLTKYDATYHLICPVIDVPSTSHSQLLVDLDYIFYGCTCCTPKSPESLYLTRRSVRLAVT